MKKILLGVTGSIAAYKAAELVRLIVKNGHEVNVVMTDAATKFISPLTFQTLSRNKVYIDQFAEQADWKPHHISLAEDCDMAIVAPATANTIAKIRCGIADNMLTSVILATKKQVAVAPAMNEGMWANEATQENLEVLRKRGILVIPPDVGSLACGSSGAGRMAAPERIFEELLKSC